MDLSLFVRLFFDILASWFRLGAALFISFVASMVLGIYIGRSKEAERLLMPIIDIFQTIPILAFFPFAIFIFVSAFPGSVGVNIAVVFLIITSMVWNMIFGAYEAIKTIPIEFTELAKLYHMGWIEKQAKIYVPAALPAVVEQASLSWAIGLFYLVTSEIFAVGSSKYSVTYGIGVALTNLAAAGDFTSYYIGLLFFVVAVILSRFLVFNKLGESVSAYKKAASSKKSSLLLNNVIAGASVFMSRMGRSSKRTAEKMMRNSVIKRAVIFVTRTTLKLSSYLIVALLAIIAYVNYPSIYSSVATYEGTVLTALAFSFARVWFAFAIAVLVAVPTCVYLIFISKHKEKFVAVFQTIASIPATILLPIIAVALSQYLFHDELIAFAVLFLSSVWYIIFSILSRSNAITQSMMEVKQMFELKGLDAWRYMYMGAITPGLITGSITAIAAEWNASIVAEYFTSSGIGSGSTISAVNIGIGKLMDLALANGNMILMGVALVNLTVMIIVINKLLWKNLYNRTASVYG